MESGLTTHQLSEELDQQRGHVKSNSVTHMKAALFIMTRKGLAVLETFLEFSADAITFVVSSHDRFTDDDSYARIEALCAAHGIPFFPRGKQPEMKQGIYIVAASWRWILDGSKLPVIVFHDSLLPRYRGFNPLVTALINGDRTIGVTALYGSRDYDSGDIIKRSASSICYPVKISAAIDIILDNYRELSRLIAISAQSGALPPGQPQIEAEASYSLWRDQDDYIIDWQKSAEEIQRMVDAVGPPYAGALSFINGEPVRILETRSIPDVAIAIRQPGKVIFVRDSQPVVVCGKGLLLIEEMIFDGSKHSALPLAKFRTRFQLSNAFITVDPAIHVG